MNDLRKAAEMALEALENHTAIKHPQQRQYRDDAIEALRQALSQPEQEPVAWGLPNLQDPIRRKQALLRVDLKIPDGAQFPQFWVPLYTAPPNLEAAVLAEREACLKEIAIELDEWQHRTNANIALNNVYAAIQARSEK